MRATIMKWNGRRQIQLYFDWYNYYSNLNTFGSFPLPPRPTSSPIEMQSSLNDFLIIGCNQYSL